MSDPREVSYTQIADVRLIDPVQGLDAHTDVWLAGGDVVAIGPAPAETHNVHVVHGHGRAMMPLITDLCVHPPATGSEPMALLRRAALAGGVGRVVWMPGDVPLDASRSAAMNEVLDSRHVLAWSERSSMPSQAPWAGIGWGLSGLRDRAALRATLQFAVEQGQTVWLAADDMASSGGGVMGEGAYALRLGLKGIDRMAQARTLDVLFNLAADTGARLHVAGLANAPAVEAVRQAKGAGLPVTADVDIHHLLLVDLDIGFFDTRLRLTPPLYGVADRDALSAAVIDGTIDAVVSGHVSVTERDKAQMFERARAGAPALGLVLPLMLSWAAAREVPLRDALAPLTRGPEQVLGVPGGLAPGMPADFCLVDLDVWWQARESQDLISPALSPYHSTMLTGRVMSSFLRGKSCWELS